MGGEDGRGLPKNQLIHKPGHTLGLQVSHGEGKVRPNVKKPVGPPRWAALRWMVERAVERRESRQGTH